MRQLDALAEELKKVARDVDKLTDLVEKAERNAGG